MRLRVVGAGTRQVRRVRFYARGHRIRTDRRRPFTAVVARRRLRHHGRTRLTARILRRAGVPHPRTWLIADGAPSPAPELPVVLKPRFGSWGRDVVLCNTTDELDAQLDRLRYRDWFREHGGMTRANGQRFREMILSRGRTEDPAVMFRAFRGRDPIVEPLLIERGLKAPPRDAGKKAK